MSVAYSEAVLGSSGAAWGPAASRMENAARPDGDSGDEWLAELLVPPAAPRLSGHVRFERRGMGR